MEDWGPLWGELEHQAILCGAEVRHLLSMEGWRGRGAPFKGTWEGVA